MGQRRTVRPPAAWGDGLRSSGATALAAGPPRRRSRRGRRLVSAAVAALLVTGGCEPAGGRAAEPCDGLAAHSETGINVNTLYDLPPVQLAAAIRTLRDLGVGWVRFDLDWKRIQPDRNGALRFASYDRLIDALGEAGVKTLVVVYNAPSWANGGHADDFFPPADAGLFAAFAGEAAARYRGKVAAWEIWNEPNISRFWKPGPDPRAYARLLRASARSIHRSDPAAVVMTAGLSQVGDGPGQVPVSAFINDVYQEIGRSDFDAVGAHPYTAPETPLLQGANNWARTWWALGGLRAVMTRYGDADKPIWATEFGAATFGDDTLRRVSEARQAELLRSAFANLPATGSGPLFWYNLRDFCSYANGRSNECYYGVQRSDGSAKPAYHTLQTVSACISQARARTMSN
jgi:hypothetical protein